MEQAGHFWHIKYPLVGGAEGEVRCRWQRPVRRPCWVIRRWLSTRRTSGISISSARRLILPLVNREIPIIADAYVDKEFGTGVVKITPAHDPNDFEVGKRHNLPELINVLNDDATINENGRQVRRHGSLRGEKSHGG